MSFNIKKLGPGLLFAGAAIGVSHLVQSTRAGADYGYGLIWALLLINIIKYPFFQFGPRYALATGESLLDGYKKLGKGVLIAYYILTFTTMFTIQTAVTIVTASLANELFGLNITIATWSIIITLFCALLLIIGKYKILDHLIKIIVIVLTITTFLAVFFASQKSIDSVSFLQIIPNNATEITFLIAFLGWMPAPLDISIWHSLWAIEKSKNQENFKSKTALFDFNIGYITTVILAVCFLSLGTFVMYNSGEHFSNSGIIFSKQLISLYTKSLGSGFSIIIAVAAFTTMFSTTLTTLDASPRAMSKATSLIFNKKNNHFFLFWILILAFGTIFILTFFTSEMQLLIKTATILSFLTAPFYAIVNYLLITSKHVSPESQPSKKLRTYSKISIFCLIIFSLWYLKTLVI